MRSFLERVIEYLSRHNAARLGLSEGIIIRANQNPLTDSQHLERYDQRFTGANSDATGHAWLAT